jgi:CheY-like chemotaxis protein
VLKGSRRAAELTGQMLAFSRRQVLQPKIVDVNRALTDIRQMIRRIIGEDIELETRFDPDLGLVRVDPGQFDQVILNIVVNARDAMPGGGKITFRTCNTRLDEPEIPSHAEIEPGTYVLLEIHDTGSGIPQEDLGHIFEPFFTTKEPGKGTGLGLSTVYGIVRQSGGHIHVDSKPGAGTVFRILLPRLDVSKRSEETDRIVQRAHGGTETILVAEDEPEVVDLIEAALHGYGYSVLAASDPELAARIARQHEGRIDLLLSDVVMPGMNGAELAMEVRTSHPEVQVLYISGYTDHPTVLEEIERKGSAFLQKPFSGMVIAAKVREVLDTNAHSPS